MLKICFQIENKILKEALQELCTQAGICVKEEEYECKGRVVTDPVTESMLPTLNLSSFLKPMCFQTILSLLKNLPYSQEITFSNFSLELRERILKNTKTQISQRLTEKECQLLCFFHQNKGLELSKDVLLKEIWSYHPDSETHTLETHIYRLRQKLEEDPNDPQVLLNCKEGYWIK